MKEVWKDIEGFEGYYQVSNLGRVKSLERIRIANNGKSETAQFPVKEKILAISKQTQGYSQASLCKDGTQKSYRLNRLVANAFIPNPDNKPEVNHIDGNKDNNCVDNLEWVTSVENIRHSWVNGLRKPRKKPVQQLDDNGNVVAEYESIKQAAETLNCSKGNICSSCKGVKGREKASGYYWRYKIE